MTDQNEKKIISLLTDINNRIDKVDMRLAFGSSNLDMLLRFANLTDWVSLSELPEDGFVLESMAEYLSADGFIYRAMDKTGIRIKLTRKGYSLLKSGGFAQIERNEQTQKRQEENKKHWWDLKMSMVQLIIMIIVAILTFFLGKCT